jgi:hypothetical protein
MALIRVDGVGGRTIVRCGGRGGNFGAGSCLAHILQSQMRSGATTVRKPFGSALQFLCGGFMTASFAQELAITHVRGQ